MMNSLSAPHFVLGYFLLLVWLNKTALGLKSLAPSGQSTHNGQVVHREHPSSPFVPVIPRGRGVFRKSGAPIFRLEAKNEELSDEAESSSNQGELYTKSRDSQLYKKEEGFPFKAAGDLTASATGRGCKYTSLFRYKSPFYLVKSQIFPTSCFIPQSAVSSLPFNDDCKTSREILRSCRSKKCCNFYSTSLSSNSLKGSGGSGGRENRGKNLSILNVQNPLDCFLNSENNSSNESLKIIIAGAPCAGKGTQCELLKKHYDLAHIATGVLLRESIEEDSPVGRVADVYIKNGQLVPDDIILELIRNRFDASREESSGWLLDGFPRTWNQAQSLKNLGVEIDFAFLLEAPEWLLFQRASNRRIDPLTGVVYNLKTRPPVSEAVWSRLTKREDDVEEVMQKRLQVFKQCGNSIKDVYPENCFMLDGSVTAEETFEEISRIIYLKRGIRSKILEDSKNSKDASAERIAVEG